MERACIYLNMYFSSEGGEMRQNSAASYATHYPSNVPIGHTIYPDQSVYAVCLSACCDSLCVHLYVCNSTKRCSQGEISSAFLSLTCFISKDELSQAGRQTLSDKTAESMSGDRW